MINACIKHAANFYKRIRLNISGKYKIGKKVRMLGTVFQGPYITIGDNCNINRCEIGEYTYMSSNVELPFCKIGKYNSIASGVRLAAGQHPKEFVSTHPIFYNGGKYKLRGKIKDALLVFNEFSYIEETNLLCEIGNDVWIGTGAMLVCGKKALHIGDGAIIGAGAVVTKDVPDYAIVTGIPARIVSYRFKNDYIRETIKKSGWWDKSAEWINANMIYFDDPEKFVMNLENTNLKE